MDGQEADQQKRTTSHVDQNTSGATGNVGSVCLARATEHPVYGTASYPVSNFVHHPYGVVDYVIDTRGGAGADRVVGSAGNRDPTHVATAPNGDGLTAEGDEADVSHASEAADVTPGS